MHQQFIRNFCIIAHIDHGKSTLADRFLEFTNSVDIRKLEKQTLDSMELERERGITIKLKAVRMNYSVGDTRYQLNLIDTPGHVDFAYEVSRSLAACEGAVLVVDASQGIEAQTVSNVFKALEANLTIIPVLNKIDLPGSNPEKVMDDLVKTFGFRKEEILMVSAKTGEGVTALLDRLVEVVPAPRGEAHGPLRGLIFDTYYDDYLGVVAHVRIVDGEINDTFIKERKKIRFFATSVESVPEMLGVLTPEKTKVASLKAGEVGFIATGQKDIHAVKVGDTLTVGESGSVLHSSVVTPLPGYKEVRPFVFASIYPIENDKFPLLRDALEKLSLSDSSLTFAPESNNALGFGFRCGFLGLLHADIIQERLEREYALELISTTPGVLYRVITTSSEEIQVNSAANLPDRSRISEIYEPWIALGIVCPVNYVGQVIQLCEARRGVQVKMEYPSEERVVFEYELPLVELINNFFDDIKSVSSGYASLDYELSDYKKVDAVRVDILVHGEIVEPLSFISVRNQAEKVGRAYLIKLKEVLPRQQFSVALQAAIGGKVIARETVPAFRKDVLQHIYGGHRERKDKLLDIQKKGKKRMKKIGKVEIPQEAFRQILKVS